MSRIISLLVSIVLIAISIYILMFIPTAVDFSNVIIRLEDNDTIYRFLIYIPMIVCLYNALLALFNAIVENRAITIVNLILSLGVALYIGMNVMGSVNAIDSIGQKLNILMYVNIATSAVLLLSFVYSFIKAKSKSKKKVKKK